MNRLFERIKGVCVCCCFSAACALAHAQDEEPIQPPKIFLDKSPRIVEFQLNRLDNARLLMVERKTDYPKYLPVFSAILTRAGMSRQDREEALGGLMRINKSAAIVELLKALDTMDAEDRQDQRTAGQLAAMLLAEPPRRLAGQVANLEKAAKSENAIMRPIGHAALLVAGETAISRKIAEESAENAVDWLSAVELIPQANVRETLWESVQAYLDESQPVDVQVAAIGALAFVPSNQAETFEKIAPLVSQPKLRNAAVRTLLKIPRKVRGAEQSAALAKFLVEHAEKTPAAIRTTEDFLNAMQLADQLFAGLPASLSKSYRERLSAVTVRVVQIHTVEEEMRYDTPYFAVEAGRPVQVVLKNEDLMPHNFVITVPGALQEVAEEGAVLGPNPGFQGKPYVPKSDKVMHATGMVNVGKLERLTFTAPTAPGEYPYVCTFPRHWMRMYGVMVVVEDLDAWLKNPIKPKDPIGSNREFVQAWRIEDFANDLTAGLEGRSPEIGAKLFKEATCAQCHRVKGEGGKVGPELTDVFKRWKGDRKGVLREILDPSHKIEPKYAVQVVLTTDGLPLTGIITAEDKDSISLLVNPEAPEPTVIPRDKIEEMVKASKSMMPKALLDRFTKDEVLEILAYLEGLNPN